MISKSRKKIILLFILISIAIYPVRFRISITNAASTLQYLVDQLTDKLETKKEEIRQLEKDAQKYKSLIEQKQKEIDSLKREMGILEAEISKVSNDIKKTGVEIEKTDLEIQDTQLEIVRYEKEISNQKVILAYMVMDMYEKTNDSNLEVFLRHNSLSDYYNNKEYLNVVENNTKSALDNLKDIKFNLEKSKTALESKKSELDELKKTIEAQKGLLDDKKAEKNNLLVNTKGKEQTYQRIKSDLEKKTKEALEEVYELENKLRSTVDPKTIPPPRSGVLAWPVVGQLTQSYGCIKTSFAKKSYPSCDNGNGGFHNGIDIAASLGTQIFAAGDGKVIASGSAPYAYGNWLVVEHDNGLVSMYAHLSSKNVNVGDTVTERQTIIGLLGSTGYSTGPHLHFTVYAPKTFLTTPSQIEGVLPIGSTLNPMSYL